MAFRKILITVDDEPLAAHAAEVGVGLARSLNAEIALVHAIDPSLIYSPEAGSVADELAQHAEQDAARIVADFRSRLPAGTSVLQFIRQGKPGQEIVRAAKDWPADLIVIGSHGRRGLSRAVLGSVAEEVMRHAPCPVLVVRRA
jgi:nucleotide-binding universal stress UspA family protein